MNGMTWHQFELQIGEAFRQHGDAAHAATVFCVCTPSPSMPRRIVWPGFR